MFVNHTTIRRKSTRRQFQASAYGYTPEFAFTHAQLQTKDNQSKRCPGGSSAPDEPQKPGVFAQVLYSIKAEGTFHSLPPCSPIAAFPLFLPFSFKLHGLLLLQDPTQLKFWPFSLHPCTSRPVGRSSPGLSVFLSHPPSFRAS